MKTKSIIGFALTLMLGLASCEMDNYDAPEAAIQGQVTDHKGRPFQTANGKGSMAIRIVETSYANGDESVVVTPQDLNMNQDGSFINTKLFAGTYTVIPYQGAFYEDLEEEVVELRGGKTTTVNFTVTPYLDLEWVDEPYIDSNGHLTASFRFTRNTKEGFNTPAPKDCRLYISRTQYCGTESDGNYTPGEKAITAEDEGQVITLSSKEPIKYSMTYWVRIGARVNDTYQKYNFTDIKEINVKVNN